jgi:hypothetical protein
MSLHATHVTSPGEATLLTSALGDSDEPVTPFANLEHASTDSFEMLSAEKKEAASATTRRRISLQHNMMADKAMNFTIKLPPRQPIVAEEILRRQSRLQSMDMETEEKDLQSNTIEDDYYMSASTSSMDIALVDHPSDALNINASLDSMHSQYSLLFRMPQELRRTAISNEYLPVRRAFSMAALSSAAFSNVSRKSSVPMSPSDLPSPVTKRLSDPLIYFKHVFSALPRNIMPTSSAADLSDQETTCPVSEDENCPFIPMKGRESH